MSACVSMCVRVSVLVCECVRFKCVLCVSECVCAC